MTEKRERDHKAGCIRLQFWDAEMDVPCTCERTRRPKTKQVEIKELREENERLIEENEKFRRGEPYLACAGLREQNERLKADAARLDWLEESFQHCPHTIVRGYYRDDGSLGDVSVLIDGCEPIFEIGKTLRQAIDRARTAIAKAKGKVTNELKR